MFTPKPKKVFLSSALSGFCCICVLTLVCASHASAESTPGNIFCRQDISPDLRNDLEAKLRHITGFSELGFDENGTLRFDRRSFGGGSKSARELLVKASFGRTAIIIEDASRRADVVFARVTPGKWKHQQQSSPPVFVVMIDFADFDALIGDTPALQAFDVGWALLHELDHVAENSRDSLAGNDVGECEDHINQMRRECNLPVRAEYFHTFLPLNTHADFKTKYVRLSFVLESNNLKKHYWVVWDATVVGGIDEPRVALAR